MLPAYDGVRLPLLMAHDTDPRRPPPPPPPATQWQACPEARPQIERTVEMSLQLRVGGCGVAASEVTPGALP